MRDLIVIGAILAAMGAVQFTAARQESQTYDEAVHLAAGFQHLHGDYRINPEHPPLGKMLAALPLLALRPTAPVEDPAWGGDARMIGAWFLYRNRVGPDAMLLAGRSVTILCTLALGLLVALWTRRHFGLPAALLALVLYATDPNLLAHGRYVTTDLYAALFSFAAAVAWQAYLERGGRVRLIGAGALLGGALAVKFSCMFLLPVFLLLWGWRRWRHAGKAPMASIPAVYALAAAVIGLVYAPETARVLLHPGSGPRLAERIEHGTWLGAALDTVARPLHLPSHTWLVGLESAARHDRIGHPTYLLGETSRQGRWQYFPVAFAVKAPLALLAAIVLAAVLALRRRGKGAEAVDVAVLVAPLVLYGALAVNSKLNIGIRHLLPMWPFLLPLIAVPLARRRSLAVAVVLLAAIEAASIYPHHLAFFNAAAGGPARGDRYLLDSNLDWGQDLIHLRRWIDSRGNPPVCLAYFGTADTAHYGIVHNGIPVTGDRAARGQLDCVAAISATLLHDVYLEPGAYAWLRERRPIDRAGYSIVLYDLRRKQ